GTPLPPDKPDDKTDSGSGGTAKDGGNDAAKDSGAPVPSPGDGCTTIDEIFERPCGNCGHQKAICEAADGGTTGVVSVYGSCEASGCAPGTNQTCGNCGTQTCTNSCTWNTCTEPVDACSPGSATHTTAGCPTANTYRQRT